MFGSELPTDVAALTRLKEKIKVRIDFVHDTTDWVACEEAVDNYKTSKGCPGDRGKIDIEPLLVVSSNPTFRCCMNDMGYLCVPYEWGKHGFYEGKVYLWALNSSEYFFCNHCWRRMKYDEIGQDLVKELRDQVAQKK